MMPEDHLNGVGKGNTMTRHKGFFSDILEERIAYRLILSFALMSIIPMLLTVYMIVTIWLPDLALSAQISVLVLLGLSVSILGFLLSRTVVYTVLKTSQAAKEIADGNLSKRLEIRNERSELGLLAQSFNEITGRLEQKVKELETSEEKFRRLVENVPDLLYYLDPDGNITSVNEEVTELLGYEKEELLNRPFTMIVDENDYMQYERVLRERRADESRLTKGLRIGLKRKDGAFRPFEINSRGIYDKDDNFIGTEGLARDITVQLALESEREEFLYMLTHDIKNPVSAVLFIIYMLRDGTIPPDKHPDYYEKVEQACNGVLRLVEDFLEFKKFDRSDVYLDTRRMNIYRMLESITRTYGSEAEAKGKTITIGGRQPEKAAADNTVILEIDEKYFQRVLENLLTNAIKFAHSRIDISVAENADGVTICVHDDGPGVSEMEKEKIFKLFHSSSGPRMKKGIGVGLASAYKIVEAHGGHLRVDSQSGDGCSFLVDIPWQATSGAVLQGSATMSSISSS